MPSKLHAGSWFMKLQHGPPSWWRNIFHGRTKECIAYFRDLKPGEVEVSFAKWSENMFCSARMEYIESADQTLNVKKALKKDTKTEDVAYHFCLRSVLLSAAVPKHDEAVSSCVLPRPTAADFYCLPAAPNSTKLHLPIHLQTACVTGLILFIIPLVISFHLSLCITSETAPSLVVGCDKCSGQRDSVAIL